MRNEWWKNSDGPGAVLNLETSVDDFRRVYAEASRHQTRRLLVVMPSSFWECFKRIKLLRARLEPTIARMHRAWGDRS